MGLSAVTDLVLLNGRACADAVGDIVPAHQARFAAGRLVFVDHAFDSCLIQGFERSSQSFNTAYVLSIAGLNRFLDQRSDS